MVAHNANNAMAAIPQVVGKRINTTVQRVECGAIITAVALTKSVAGKSLITHRPHKAVTKQPMTKRSLYVTKKNGVF